MKGLEKLTVKLGRKPVAILTLVVSCLAVVVSLFWQHQQAGSQYQNLQQQSQQHTSQLIVAAVSAQVQAMTQQVAATAKSPTLATALKTKNQTLIDQQQAVLSSVFPNADKVCLIAADVDQADPNACLPITFATLNSLRQAKLGGNAPVGILGLGTDKAYLLFAQRIVDAKEQVVGVLLLALDPSVVESLLLDEYGSEGYVELQQGTKGVTKVASKGNAQFKQGKASFSTAIPNSYWRVAYWSQIKGGTGLPIIIMAVLLIVLTVLWLLRETWQQLLLKQDVKTLRQQLKDYQNEMLKPKYPMADALLRDVIDDIQTMGREHSKVKAKKVKGEISKAKVDEPGQGNSLQREAEQELQSLTEIDASIFKAYDIRGIVGESLNESVFQLIGKAVGSEAIEQNQTRLVVGRDGRLASDSLTKALIEGILTTGCGVIDIGKVPTPLVYFACEELGTKSGVMVTGSHNPAEYNGLKIVIAGKTFAGADIQSLYRRIEQNNFETGQAEVNQVSVVDDYIKRIVGDVHTRRSIKVVIDCGNGIAGVVAPRLLRELGCEVIELYCDVDGNFPNHHPNPSQEENLQDLAAAVEQFEAELGLAFDGDGDRLGVVDASGQPIWPDRLMVMFAQDVLSRESEATVIYDVKSTSLLGDAITRAGGIPVVSPSGYSIIKNKIQETGAKLAGELSGHIFFNDRWYGFDDGLYSACRLLEFLSNDPLERTPSDVFAALPYRESTPEIFIAMDEGESKLFVSQLKAEASFPPNTEIIVTDGLRVEYPTGWGLVRVSNTMPGLTLRFEANSEDELEQIKQQFIQQMLQVKPSLSLSL